MFIIVLHIIVGFIAISLLTRHATEDPVSNDEFIIGIIIWPVVVLYVFIGFISKLFTNKVYKKLNDYISWLQKDIK